MPFQQKVNLLINLLKSVKLPSVQICVSITMYGGEDKWFGYSLFQQGVGAMSRISVKRSDLTIGKAIPWSIYDKNEMLLLRKGFIIQSQRQLDRLLSCGLMRKGNSSISAGKLTAERGLMPCSPSSLTWSPAV